MTLKQFDPTLRRFEKGNDWLVTFDTFTGTMRAQQEYALLQYLSYAIVPFHPLFQERGGGRIERPKADWEVRGSIRVSITMLNTSPSCQNYMQTKTNEEIYTSLSRVIRSTTTREAAGLRHLLANEILQLEFAPYLNRMISPPLKPVSLSHFTTLTHAHGPRAIGQQPDHQTSRKGLVISACRHHGRPRASIRTGQN